MVRFVFLYSVGEVGLVFVPVRVLRYLRYKSGKGLILGTFSTGRGNGVCFRGGSRNLSSCHVLGVSPTHHDQDKTVYTRQHKGVATNGRWLSNGSFSVEVVFSTNRTLTSLGTSVGLSLVIATSSSVPPSTEPLWVTSIYFLPAEWA